MVKANDREGLNEKFGGVMKVFTKIKSPSILSLLLSVFSQAPGSDAPLPSAYFLCPPFLCLDFSASLASFSFAS